MYKEYKKDGKVCSGCKEYKLVSEYNLSKRDGIQSRCISCKKNQTRSPEYIKKNNEKRREKTKTNTDFNQKKSISKKKWYLKNREDQLEYAKKYSDLNKEKIRRYSIEYNKKRKNEDPLYKLICLTRSRISEVLKTNGLKRECKSKEYIGCDLKVLKAHLESTFQEGMTCENHGEWHIDHITPLCSSKTEEDVYRLSHYTNLQALWAIDNLKKGGKYGVNYTA
jgi:hypothetical protein